MVASGTKAKGVQVAYANNASSYIQWQVIRKNSCFLKRQRGIPKLFSTEKFNVKGVNSPRFNGLINKTGVDVQPTPKNDGIVLTTKNKRHAATPAKSVTTVSISGKGPRRTLKSVRNRVGGYKPAHLMFAMRRASQILRSQKAPGQKKGAASTGARKAVKTEA
ncbi:ribosomal l28e protein family domain-containing protein [Ditylenchus destructor]|nr:ribosomal l28e protein family domain-containing protein [Ditylenchus destructor]